MPITRRFVVAGSLARLVHKECGSERVTEGHFAPHSERQSHVRIESGRSHLILTSVGDSPDAPENITDLPGVHGEALLEVATGRVALQRSRLQLGSHEAFVDRFTAPAPLALASIEFASAQEADAFTPASWLGPEVTNDDSYTRRAIALSGRPPSSEPAVSDAALNGLLDHIEGSTAQASAGGSAPELMAAPAEDSTFAALRRLAASPSLTQPTFEVGEGTGTELAGSSRRPLLQPRPATGAGDDARLASIIDGLSDALAQAPADQNGAGNEVAQSRWRWSAH